MTQPARETVLVVDDEEMVRRLAVRMLLGEGYKVLEAKSPSSNGAHLPTGVVIRSDGGVTPGAATGLPTQVPKNPGSSLGVVRFHTDPTSTNAEGRSPRLRNFELSGNSTSARPI